MDSPKRVRVGREESQGQNPGKSNNFLKEHVKEGEPMKDTPKSTRKPGLVHQRC